MQTQTALIVLLIINLAAIVLATICIVYVIRTTRMMDKESGQWDEKGFSSWKNQSHSSVKRKHQDRAGG